MITKHLTSFSFHLECTKSSCTPAAADVDPKLFNGFKKTVTWHINVPDRTVLTLFFPAEGLKGISAAETCQDGYQYTVTTARSDGELKTNIYCKGGTVSHLDLFGATTLTVEVPKGGELENSAFNAKATPRREDLLLHHLESIKTFRCSLVSNKKM